MTGYRPLRLQTLHAPWLSESDCVLTLTLIFISDVSIFFPHLSARGGGDPGEEATKSPRYIVSNYWVLRCHPFGIFVIFLFSIFFIGPFLSCECAWISVWISVSSSSNSFPQLAFNPNSNEFFLIFSSTLEHRIHPSQCFFHSECRYPFMGTIPIHISASPQKLYLRRLSFSHTTPSDPHSPPVPTSPIKLILL